MKTVELLDFCLPDYFTGYHKPVIAVPVYGIMTQKEIGEEILSELNSIYDFISQGYSEEEIDLIEKHAFSLINNDTGIFKEGIDPSYGMTDDDEFFEPCYLYFAVCQITYANGLMFLNP